MKRAFKAVMSAITYAANFWWAGVVYMVAGIVFMVLTTMSNFGVSYLERRVNRGVRRA